MADRMNLSFRLLAFALLLPAGAWAQPAMLVDPTRPPAGVDRGAPLAEVGVSPLQSVLIPKKGRPLAVIGGQTVPLGGKYGDSTLTAINEREVVRAATSGTVQHVAARAVGNAAWRLGAGRARKEDPVSPSAGVRLLAKPGDRVTAGAPLLELLADEPTRIPDAVAALDGAFVIDDSPFTPRPLVHERISR